MIRKTPLLLAAAFAILATAPTAFGQSFTGPATITQPTIANHCVKVGPGGANNLVDAGAVCGTSSAVGANPTATIGATAVNGSSANFMRADAAPALPSTLPALNGSLLTNLSGGNITAGTVANAALANSSLTIAGHSVALGGTQAIACSDLSNGATGCSTTTGTSGATIPLLNGTNTWSGVQSVNSGDLALKGASSGTLTINAAAAAGTSTLTLPGGTTDFSATGGTSQVIKQTGAGAAFTVARLACSDLSDSGTGCAGTIGSYLPLAGGTLTGQLVDNLNTGSVPTAITGTGVVVSPADGVTGRVQVNGYAAIAAFTAARYDGTAASPTGVAINDQIGGYNSYAYGSNAALNGPIASIRCYATDTISGTSWGSKCAIATSATGTTTLTDKLIVDQAGGVTAVGAYSGPVGSASATTYNEGTAGTGMYGTSTAVLFATAGTLRWTLDSGGLQSGANQGGILRSAAPSSTVPGYIPNSNSTNTGVGAQAAGNMSEIVGGVETGRWVSGGLQIPGALISTGTAPTLTGSCTAGAQTGGNTAGTIVLTCVAQTVILTFATTAPTGWNCNTNDRTTPADSMKQTASSTTTATLTGTTVALDVVSFDCRAY